MRSNKKGEAKPGKEKKSLKNEEGAEGKWEKKTKERKEERLPFFFFFLDKKYQGILVLSARI